MHGFNQKPLTGSRARYWSRRVQAIPLIACDGTSYEDSFTAFADEPQGWRALRRGYLHHDDHVVRDQLDRYRLRRAQALRSAARRDRQGTPLVYIDAVLLALESVLDSRAGTMVMA